MRLSETIPFGRAVGRTLWPVAEAQLPLEAAVDGAITK